MINRKQEDLYNDLSRMIKAYEGGEDCQHEVTVLMMLSAAIINNRAQQLAESVCLYGEKRLEELNAKLGPLTAKMPIG